MTYAGGGLALGLLACLVPVGPAPAPGRHDVRVPPANVRFDYQLGGSRPVGAGPAVVVRDRAARPAGRYDVCYVNGFQTQPHERRFWRSGGRWRLVLKRADGTPVVDEAWGEWLLDTRTAPKRRALAGIVGGWTAGCAGRGYEGVEYDNLDSWTRSGRLLHRSGALAYARLLARRAHAEGLAVAQKNTPQLGRHGPRAGFDFVIVEECERYRECAAYRRVYGRHVYAVEYTRPAFRRSCRLRGAAWSVIFRRYSLLPDGPRAGC